MLESIVEMLWSFQVLCVEIPFCCSEEGGVLSVVIRTSPFVTVRFPSIKNHQFLYTIFVELGSKIPNTPFFKKQALSTRFEALRNNV